MAYSIGETVKGTVSGVTDYGAFVRLEDGSVGMVHISKLSREFVSDIRSFIKKGDNVEATVISNDNDKLGLSLIGDTTKKREFGERRTKRSESESTDFESMLSSFKTASDEKLAGLSRGRDKSRKKRK